MRPLFTTCILMGSSLAIQAEEDIHWNQFDVGMLASRHNLEGPAITGRNDIEGEDESGLGLYTRLRYGISQHFHISADLSFESIADEITLIRGSLAPGLHWDLRPGFALYSELGLCFASSSGLENYKNLGPTAEGNGGSDFGLLALVGFRHRFSQQWEWQLAAAYMSFGEENYPEGQSSPGDGPHFEAGLSYDVKENVAISAGWTGTWVEDGGIQMDLATQQFRLGLRIAY